MSAVQNRRDENNLGATTGNGWLFLSISGRDKCPPSCNSSCLQWKLIGVVTQVREGIYRGSHEPGHACQC